LPPNFKTAEELGLDECVPLRPGEEVNCEEFDVSDPDLIEELERIEGLEDVIIDLPSDGTDGGQDDGGAVGPNPKPGDAFCSEGTAVVRDGVCVAIPEGGYCEDMANVSQGLPGVIRNGICDTTG
jgi:hypothetical protein